LASLVDFRQLNAAGAFGPGSRYTGASNYDPSSLRDLPQSFTAAYGATPGVPKYAFYDPRNFGPRGYADGGIVTLRRSV
jgi:hypothetical protein